MKTHTRPSRRRIALLLAPFLLSGCMVGPDYKRPTAIISPRFKELKPAEGWQYANPALAAAPKGRWWEIYNDRSPGSRAASREESRNAGSWTMPPNITCGMRASWASAQARICG